MIKRVYQSCLCKSLGLLSSISSGNECNEPAGIAPWHMLSCTFKLKNKWEISGQPGIYRKTLSQKSKANQKKKKWEITYGMSSYRILINCQMKLIAIIFKSLQNWSHGQTEMKNIYPKTSVKIQDAWASSMCVLNSPNVYTQAQWGGGRFQFGHTARPC